MSSFAHIFARSVRCRPHGGQPNLRHGDDFTFNFSLTVLYNWHDGYSYNPFNTVRGEINKIAYVEVAVLALENLAVLVALVMRSYRGDAFLINQCNEISDLTLNFITCERVGGGNGGWKPRGVDAAMIQHLVARPHASGKVKWRAGIDSKLHGLFKAKATGQDTFASVVSDEGYLWRPG